MQTSGDRARKKAAHKKETLKKIAAGPEEANIDRVLKTEVSGKPELVIERDYEYRITKAQIAAQLGRKASSKLTDVVMEMIDRLDVDTGLDKDIMNEQFMSNINLVNDMGLGMKAYISAIKYCSLKQNISNRKAYSIVFPERVLEQKEREDAAKAEGIELTTTLDHRVAAYNKGKLVVAIDAQLHVAFSALYSNQRHRALNVLVDLTKGKCAPNASGEAMTVTPMVQMQAASKILDELRPPEENAVQVDVNVNTTGLQEGLADQLARMADQQMERLKMGEDISTVQLTGLSSDGIVEAEIDE